MRGWVNADYAGTGIAVGEYNWGALGYLNGALAQADVLGIFGREGLDLATLWDPPTANQPGAFAFRLYRNYDGYGRGFGDVSVRATSTDQDSLAIYAAQRNFDGALTLMVINKTGAPLSASVALTGFTPGSSAQVYRYDANSLNSIVHLPDLPVSGGALNATWPASSITLLVLLPGPGGATPLHLFLPLLRR
jgi:hypothetical protein